MSILILIVAFATAFSMLQPNANNPYVELMYGEFSKWSFDEKATENRGYWREKIFECDEDAPLDLEIGTGNGTHFAHYAEKYPNRYIIGLELKFKTLVQSIRRTLRAGCKNGRMVRFDATDISLLFGKEEINNVFIQFPDPWPKRRQQKNRLIQESFLKEMYCLMKPGAKIDFKTDHYGYFLWAVQKFRSSDFVIEFYTEDLHNSFRKDKNFVTHFETLFLKKKQPIFSCLLRKN